jgi:conjugal transfer pilus assembly protein TraV
MSSINMPPRVVLLVIVGAAAACSAIGEKDFSCPGRPPGVRCMSTTEVYGATNNTDYVEPTSEEALGDDPTSYKRGVTGPFERRVEGRASGAVPPTDYRPADAGVVRTEVVAPEVERPIPIRTPARVMRVWIAPWEDLRGVLHAGGYAFIEIESRRWTFGETATAEPVRFFSLQSIATEAKETVGKDQRAPAARAGTSERLQRTNSSTLPSTGAPK